MERSAASRADPALEKRLRVGFRGQEEVLLNTYGHHHPDYLSDAVENTAMREPTGERKHMYLVRCCPAAKQLLISY
jgi:hypothetical protein